MHELMQKIHQHERFVIVCHVDPDGDALGSGFALLKGLQALGKHAQMVCQDDCPQLYRFMALSNTLQNTADVSQPYVFFSVDCTDRGRLGTCAALLDGAMDSINVDHHISNTHFCALNYVQPQAASCSDIIMELLQNLQITITQEMAESLFVGISTDTGHFVHGNTNAQCLQNAATLLQTGISASHLCDLLYHRAPANSVALLGKVLNTLTLLGEGAVAHIHVTQEMMRQTDTTIENASGIITRIQYIEGVKIALYFTQLQDGGTKVSMRSAEGYDVRAIAQQFGGGGHVRAAGCTILADIDDAIAQMERAALAVL